MLFEIMLFLIKAEASTLEGNSDPPEKWRVKIVQGNESQRLLFRKDAYMFLSIVMNFMFANQCDYLNDNRYCLEEPTHYNLYMCMPTYVYVCVDIYISNYIKISLRISSSPGIEGVSLLLDTRPAAFGHFCRKLFQFLVYVQFSS